ncbi:MAG: hypothetical protein QG597_246 [Actinomycetota bacterium]|nr:hypothetical protein [Actinomycetota bacterium]
MTVNVRGARLDQADAEAYARFLDSAADGLFRSMFGGAMVPVVARVSLVPGTEMSLEHVSVAEVDGTVVGMCSGCVGPQADVSGPMLRAAGIRAVRAAAVVLAALPVLRALERREPGEWYLQSIAVDEGARGLGVGTLLFEDAIARARAAGADRLVLDVETRNTRAQALYERLGLRVESTSAKAWLAGSVQVHRMGRDL